MNAALAGYRGARRGRIFRCKNTMVLTVRDLAHLPGDFNGNPRRGASATATVKRSEFGIVFNKVLEAGGVAIADEVSLRVDISLVRA